MDDVMIKRDVFLRIGNGKEPIQARYVDLFSKTQVEQGINSKTPVVVTAHSEAEYKAQRKKHARR